MDLQAKLGPSPVPPLGVVPASNKLLKINTTTRKSNTNHEKGQPSLQSEKAEF